MKSDSIARLAFGLLTGVAFGALLQRGRVSRCDVIVGQLQRRDWTVAKVMGTAIAVGATGMHALAKEGRGEFKPRSLQLGGTLGGGVMFGTGLTLLGYCPGTALAAAGEGRRDAVVGVLGMLTGAALFVRCLPALKSLISAGDFGKPSLPTSTKLPPWVWILAYDSAVAWALLNDHLPRRRSRRFTFGRWLPR